MGEVTCYWEGRGFRNGIAVNLDLVIKFVARKHTYIKSILADGRSRLVLLDLISASQVCPVGADSAFR